MPPAATSSVTNGITTYYVPVPGGNLYYIFAFGIAVAYGIILIMAILLTIVVYWMSDMVPEDFVKIGKCKRWTAVFTKILPPIIILIHWIILLLILVFWVMILMGSCEVTQPSSTIFGFNSLKYGRDSFVLNLVTSIIWVLLHYGGAIYRDITYTEPFMYSPDIGETSAFKSLVLKKLGP